MDRVVGTDEFLENLYDILSDGDGFVMLESDDMKAQMRALADSVVSYVRDYVLAHYVWKED